MGHNWLPDVQLGLSSILTGLLITESAIRLLGRRHRHKDRRA